MESFKLIIYNMQYLTKAGVKFLNEKRPGHPHPSFGFAWKGPGLSPELLNRASKQAGDDVTALKDYANTQIKRSTGPKHAYHDHKRKPRRSSDGTLKDNPYTTLAVKLRSVAKDRANQGTRFAARAKGVKTKRPSLGYPVGYQIRNVWRQALAQFQIDKNDYEEKKRRERGEGDDVFPK